MQCREIEELLYLHRDGELEQKEQKLLVNHLRKCMNCQEKLAELKQMDAVVESVRTETSDFGKDFVPELMRLIRTPGPEQAREHEEKPKQGQESESVQESMVEPDQKPEQKPKQEVSREPVREQKKEPEQPPAPAQNQTPKTKPESKHTRRPKLKPGLKELERFIPDWVTVHSLRIALAIIIGILAASFIAEQVIAISQIASLEEKMAEQTPVNLRSASGIERIAMLYAHKRSGDMGTKRLLEMNRMLQQFGLGDGKTERDRLRFSQGIPFLDERALEKLVEKHTELHSGLELFTLMYRLMVQEAHQ